MHEAVNYTDELDKDKVQPTVRVSASGPSELTAIKTPIDQSLYRANREIQNKTDSVDETRLRHHDRNTPLNKSFRFSAAKRKERRKKARFATPFSRMTTPY